MEVNIITLYQEVWLLSQMPTSPAYVVPSYRSEVVYPHAGKVWIAPTRTTLSEAQKDAADYITNQSRYTRRLKPMITYLNPQDVTAVRQTETPHNYSRTGYGNKLPTSWQVRIHKRWHRIYVICYSNCGSAYVRISKNNLYLGSWEPTDHYISSNKEVVS